jgi:hypothetical protein
MEEQLGIIRDAEDGYYTVWAYNGMPNDSRIKDPQSEVVGFGHTLYSALGDLEGNLMEFGDVPCCAGGGATCNHYPGIHYFGTVG